MCDGLLESEHPQEGEIRALQDDNQGTEKGGATMNCDLSKLRNSMQIEGLDCIVVTTRQNVLYCTGHNVATIDMAGRLTAVILPLSGDPVFCLETNEAFEAKTWIKDVRVYKEGGEWEPLKPWEFVARVLEEKKLAKAKIGMEILT